jgi:alcohol dehydrogenase class IV
LSSRDIAECDFPFAQARREIRDERGGLGDETACERLLSWLTDLTGRPEVPSLRTFGATAQDIPGLVGLTLEHFSTINPRQLRIEDAAAIYEAAL